MLKHTVSHAFVYLCATITQMFLNPIPSPFFIVLFFPTHTKTKSAAAISFNNINQVTRLYLAQGLEIAFKFDFLNSQGEVMVVSSVSLTNKSRLAIYLLHMHPKQHIDICTSGQGGKKAGGNKAKAKVTGHTSEYTDKIKIKKTVKNVLVSSFDTILESPNFEII